MRQNPQSPQPPGVMQTSSPKHRAIYFSKSTLEKNKLYSNRGEYTRASNMRPVWLFIPAADGQLSDNNAEDEHGFDLRWDPQLLDSSSWLIREKISPIRTEASTHAQATCGLCGRLSQQQMATFPIIMRRMSMGLISGGTPNS